MSDEKKAEVRSKFPPLYWLVVMFEFFERGAYYGMMSILSVYMVDELGIPKQDVGGIKGFIQPILYFLPIISGALADRFGYRKMLTIAFALLGGGYLLTSQANDYVLIFLALVVMALGAGTFKPVISGTIARCTDESNSTLGFGIFYWSINLGAFLFPFFLVPALRDNVGYSWVIVASAICTGAMLLPTLTVFREPPRSDEDEPKDKEKPGLLQTMANAFEIIFSPVVLLHAWARRSGLGKGLAVVLVAGSLGYGVWDYLNPNGFIDPFSAKVYEVGQGRLEVWGEPKLTNADPYEVSANDDERRLTIQLFKPDEVAQHAAELSAALAIQEFAGAFAEDTLRSLRMSARQVLRNPAVLPAFLTEVAIALDGMNQSAWRSEDDWLGMRDGAVEKTILEIRYEGGLESQFSVKREGSRVFLLLASTEAYEQNRDGILAEFARDPHLAALSGDRLDSLASSGRARSILFLFAGILLGFGLLAIVLASRFQAADSSVRTGMYLLTFGLLGGAAWLLPDVGLIPRVWMTLIGASIPALFAIDYQDIKRFGDHIRFLVMIVIYSGFWILYFQMFDSVLWYVQAYVDPSALNDGINGALAAIGIESSFRFDVEAVTWINAGTIILLQILISNIVKKTKALPTMIVGITLGTIGMAILSISTGIWVFMGGIILFSIGEMTAHPKFISFVGQTAPKARVAMYMGYLFLYGVFGSSVGAVVGANLYVKYVDEMNQPQTLWLIFASIGVATVVGLLLYNKFLVKKEPETSSPDAERQDEEENKEDQKGEE